MSGSRVLVIAPHPDDEAIGCGGSLRRHVDAGDQIRVIFLTSGEKGGHSLGMEETARIREGEARQAARILGLRDLEFWRQPDGVLRVTRTLVERLVRALRGFRPVLVYAPHPGEMHPDHRAAARLLKRAVRGLAACERPAGLRLYEVWTPIPRIGHIEDISEQIELKMEAIRAYDTQCRVMRFDDAARGLARYRGEMHSWPGGEFAEVFATLDPPADDN